MMINTLHGGKYAAMLIEERIPFSVTYKPEYEFQGRFRVPDENYKRALELLMKMRGSMLSG
jgi:hypothetical protein